MLHHWGGDQDVFGLYREGGFIEAIVLMVRNGKLTSTQGWSFQDLEFPDDDVLADLLTQYYAGARFCPTRSFCRSSSRTPTCARNCSPSGAAEGGVPRAPARR